MPEIISNDYISSDYYYMKVDAPEVAVQGLPGQFAHIKVNSDQKSYDPLLRRPFSFFDINKEKGIIEIVYCAVGRGTRILSTQKKGFNLDILGPLGKNFNYNLNGKNILIVGGGMGIAPLYYLTKKLVTKNQVKVLLGGNSKDDIYFFIKHFTNLKLSIEYATIDGSKGYQGTVTDLWENEVNSKEIDFIFSCGPVAMLKKIKKIAGEQNIPGQVSLEERMGCGIGVCLSCICKTENGNARVCKEGPVFSLKEVIFDE